MLGALGLNWANSEALKGPAPGSGSPLSGGVVVNHVETVTHSANVQAAGNYHIEAQLGDQGTLVLYIYGQAEKQLFPISRYAPDTGMEAVAVVPGDGSLPLTLAARPVSTDPTGLSSRFVAKIDRSLASGAVGLSLTVPIEGASYRLQWQPGQLIPGASVGDAAMPAAVGDAEAQKLFLTPGGLYTDADIKANGSQTATQKYGSQMSQHNAHPKPGEALCPISETAANPKFSWVIGGKKYLFCCPPCIEEFVKQAKEKPESIKSPESYIKL